MKKKVILRGPLLTRSGYGEHARFVLRALRSQPEKYDIYAVAVNWGKTSWVHDISEEREFIDAALEKTILYHQQCQQQKVPVEYDLSLQVTIPNEWEKIAKVNVGVTAGIETTKVSVDWIEKSFLMDRIIVVSDHSKNVYKSTSYNVTNQKTNQTITDFKCTTPIDVVPYPVKNLKTPKLDLELSTDFNFLAIAQWGPRKNMEMTVLGFVKEFENNENVGLVIKSSVVKNNLLDRNALEAGLKDLLKDYPDRKCKVYLLHGDMTEEEIHSLYTNKKIKAYVTTTHGEGFGLPIFEAAYTGMPIIAPDWSGQVDFLYKPKKDKKGKVKNRSMFSKIDYTLRPVQEHSVWKGVVVADSMWCYPEESSYRHRMTEVYEDHGRFKKQATELKKWILANFSAEGIYQKFNESIEACYSQKEITTLKTPQITSGDQNSKYMML